MGKEKEKVKKAAAVVEEAKKKVEEKKAERKEKDEDAEAEKSPPPLLLQPPQAVTVAAAEEEVVVMRVFMDCVGCARKVRRALKGFEGVDEIKTDYKTRMVAVKGRGAAAEPTKMVERIYSKCGKKAELIIIPRPAPLPPLLLPPMASRAAPEKSKENNNKNKEEEEEEKEEPQVVVAVLNIRMHCEACAQEIKKKILKVKGVHEADPNLVASQVTVKGVFNPATLAEYVHKRTRKHVTVAAVQVPPLADAPLAAENRQNPNQEAEDGGAGGKKQKGKKQKDEENKNEKKSGGIEEAAAAAATEPTVVVVGPTAAAEASVAGEGGRQVTNEHRNANSDDYYYYYYYQPHYPVEFYAYPPQIFSDENPNACVVM